MTDDLTKRGPPDQRRINVNEPWEVKAWCDKFGVTEAELRAAVKVAGVMAKDVAKQLGKPYP
ncbi:DUF3606 domain-containing protein [Methylobacterium sp. J-090]|uniref:DUF3606 domain-containing protein n=1 Tax=Methylobacterium sp. J-090 TaxID=2836666 RepID=UPI001FBB9348|nr:DUF3606 domain-containing protein [Methylobacterium sp. J-090]MCJ2081149.1 DUF3606 domain-containing protein [Methylobacterium sp. J-090]